MEHSYFAEERIVKKIPKGVDPKELFDDYSDEEFNRMIINQKINNASTLGLVKD
jgi:hypothetical protein